MNSASLFAVECKLTCLGGSEKGTCDCRGPNDCVARNTPGFQLARGKAKKRMGRFLMNELEK